MKIKTRNVVVRGATYTVPKRIQRIDIKGRSTHGWQVRNVIKNKTNTKFFSDGIGAGVSLDAAIDHLIACIREHDSPYAVGSIPFPDKTSNLPSGISGPTERMRVKGHIYYVVFEYSLHLPQYDRAPRHRTVYIASRNTCTAEKEAAALAKAIKLRTTAEDAWNRAAYAAKQAEIPEILKLKGQGAQAGARVL